MLEAAERGGAGERELERALGGLHGVERRRQLEGDGQGARDLGEVLDRLRTRPRGVRPVVEDAEPLQPARGAEGHGEQRREAAARRGRAPGRGRGSPRRRRRPASLPRMALSETWRRAAGEASTGSASRREERGRARRLAGLRDPEGRVPGARDAGHAREHGLERRFERRAGEQVLRRRHGLAKVLEALARDVALLAQLGERGAQLGGGLGVGLDELARLRVGGPRREGLPRAGRAAARTRTTVWPAGGGGGGVGRPTGASPGSARGIGRVTGEACASNARRVRPKSSRSACSAHCRAGAPSFTSRIA